MSFQEILAQIQDNRCLNGLNKMITTIQKSYSTPRVLRKVSTYHVVI